MGIKTRNEKPYARQKETQLPASNRNIRDKTNWQYPYLEDKSHKIKVLNFIMMQRDKLIGLNIPTMRERKTR